jgi:hypothetical protein
MRAGHAGSIPVARSTEISGQERQGVNVVRPDYREMPPVQRGYLGQSEPLSYGDDRRIGVPSGRLAYLTTRSAIRA